MQLKVFDVVKLKDNNKAIILSIEKENKMYTEIVDNNGKKVENRHITRNEIVDLLTK